MSLRIVSLGLVLAPLTAAADALPSVASINLCSDQLVLSIADPAQVRSVSWLAADPHESMLHEEARRHPLNYGSAEEILRLAPDVVVAGVFTNTFTRRLLRELGHHVVDVVPADSIADIERNLRQVGAALEREARADALIAEMRVELRALARARRATPVSAVVVRPGGFTVGARTLADELLRLAGLRNVAAEGGLDRWGSLSMETLLRTSPAMLVFTDYRPKQSSLANLVLEHPALSRLARRTTTVSIAGKYWACGLPESLHSVELLQIALRQSP